MSTVTPQPGPFATWAEMLDSLERSLEDWSARAVEPPLPEPPQPTDRPVPLKLFEEYLTRLQANLDKAEQNAQKAEGPLTADIEALQQWQGRLQTGRRHLAEHLDLSVRGEERGRTSPPSPG